MSKLRRKEVTEMQQHKEIILSEIEYWRKNRLLPAAYCDFLTRLYSEGTDSSVSTKASHKTRWGRIGWLLGVIGVGILIVLATLFWISSGVLPHALGLFLIGLILAGIGITREKSSKFKWLFCALSALFVLLSGVTANHLLGLTLTR